MKALAITEGCFELNVIKREKVGLFLFSYSWDGKERAEPD